MSADASVEFDWAGDLRRFRLPIERLVALEDACDCTSMELFDRLSTARWGVRDVRETIRLGLIGGGCDGKAARELIDEHVRDGKLFAHAIVARAILAAAIYGRADDPPGKAPVAKDAAEADASPSPP